VSVAGAKKLSPLAYEGRRPRLSKKDEMLEVKYLKPAVHAWRRNRPGQTSKGAVNLQLKEKCKKGLRSA